MERHRGYFQFFEQYPGAERKDHVHSNGYTSTIAVGLFSGQVDAAFIGVYKPDGGLRSEENFPLDVLEESFGRNLNFGLLLSELTEMAAAKAGAPIRS